MKRCCRCRFDLSEKMFSNNKRNSDGLHTSCRKCKSEEDEIYRAKNAAKISVVKHQYYLKNKNDIVGKVCLYSKQNRKRCNRWSKVARTKLKIEVFSHYCGGLPKCKCGVDDLGLLTLDHIHGNGNQHRKEIGVKTGYAFYQWVKRNNYPVDFQVLCWNCQFRKRKLEMAPDGPLSKRQEQKKAVARSVKELCLQHYGGICPCGCDDIDVLTLDHVNDDGAAHRKETDARGYNFYLMLRKNGFPIDPPLQVKCLNCQYRKRNEKYERECGSADDCEDAGVFIRPV